SRARASLLRDSRSRGQLRAAQHTGRHLHRRRLARARRRADWCGADRSGPARDPRPVAPGRGGGMNPRQPPRLLVKTMAVTFVMATVLLLLVFGVVTFTVRGQVRRAVAANL